MRRGRAKGEESVGRACTGGAGAGGVVVPVTTGSTDQPQRQASTACAWPMVSVERVDDAFFGVKALLEKSIENTDLASVVMPIEGGRRRRHLTREARSGCCLLRGPTADAASETSNQTKPREGKELEFHTWFNSGLMKALCARKR